MAFGDMKGNEPIYILLLAALAGAFLKTTIDDRSQKGNVPGETTSAAKQSAPKGQPTPSASASPEDLDPSDVIGALRDLGYPASEPCAPQEVNDGKVGGQGGQDGKDGQGGHGGHGGKGGKETQLAVVVALLPDPATSGFVREFDNGIQAVQESAQSQGFTVVRHWTPWTREGSTMKARADAHRAGWMLFREDLDDGKFRALLVLVVGERVGAGVQRAMLNDALELRDKLKVQAPLLILGPYFSGTAASLRAGLEAWCQGKPAAFCGSQRAEVISGSATRWLNASLLESTRCLSVRFQATANPDGALSNAMHEYLRSALRVSDNHVAQLTETSTPFGSSHSRTVGKLQNGATPESNAPNGRQVLSIAFPGHLPDLRGAAAEPKAPARDLRENEVSVDAVPLLNAEGLTASTQLLASTIDDLRLQGITDVGVLATGTIDKVSLVAALRGAAADIRPHVYEANLTLADPEVRRAMDGTLVASSYPLSSMTQIWSRSDVRPFASDAAEGIHNALLALLWRGQVITDTRLTRSIRDYGFPFEKDRPVGPPVWISVIVGGRLWPLAVYTFDWPGANAYIFGRPHPSGGPTPALVPSAFEPPRVDRSRFATILLALLLALAAGNLLSLVERLPALRRIPILLFYEPPADPPASTPCNGAEDAVPDTRGRTAHSPGFLHLDRLEDAHARPALLLGIWVTSLAGWTAAALYEMPLMLKVSYTPGIGDLVAAVLYVASTLLILVPFRAFPAHPPADPEAEPNTTGRPPSADPGHRMRAVVHAALVAVTLFTAIYVLFSFVKKGTTDGRAFFLFVRLMNPKVGLTPAPPMAVMAIALYIASMFRLRVVRRGTCLRQAAHPWKGTAVPGACEGLRDFADQSLRSLTPIFWLGAGLGVLLFLWRSMRPRTLEGPAFDLFVALGFGVTFAVAGASLWRADNLCRRLTRFVRGLAVHPLAPAFSTMPAHISQTFRTPMPGRIRREEIDRAVAVSVMLAQTNPVEPVAKDDASGGPPPVSPGAEPPDERGHQIEQYLKELEPKWREKDELPPALRDASGKPPLAPVRLREHVLALRMTESLSTMCDATRTTLFVGSVSAIAAVLATAVYPFQHIVTLQWLARITVGIVVVVALRVIGGIERDDILSRVAGTDPGKVTPSWSLAVRLVGYVLVPLSTLAAPHLFDRGQLTDLLSVLGSTTAR